MAGFARLIIVPAGIALLMAFWIAFVCDPEFKMLTMIAQADIKFLLFASLFVTGAGMATFLIVRLLRLIH